MVERARASRLSSADSARTGRRAHGCSAPTSSPSLPKVRGSAGASADGLAAVNEGLVLAETTLDRGYAPELWRLKGELLLASQPSVPSRSKRGRRQARSAGDVADPQWQEAERCLLRALDCARGRGSEVARAPCCNQSRSGMANPGTHRGGSRAPRRQLRVVRCGRRWCRPGRRQASARRARAAEDFHERSLELS